MIKDVFTSVELATNATVTLELSAREHNKYTKLTMQVVDGAVAPIAGTISILAKIDKENTDSSFQTIGSFDMTAKVPVFVEGAYEELQFIGATMTASSSAFIVVAATD